MAPNYVMSISTKTPEAIAQRQELERQRLEKKFCFRFKKGVRNFFTVDFWKKKKTSKPVVADDTTVVEVEPQAQPATPVLLPQTGSPPLEEIEPLPALSDTTGVAVSSRELTDEEARADGANVPGPAAGTAEITAAAEPGAQTVNLERASEETIAAKPAEPAAKN